ncbi:MAG: efflux RND transporter periplasmic adaptor subunit [Paracoccaceae bacterium]
MRIVPVLMAAGVAVLLYFIIIDRDTFISFVKSMQGTPPVGAEDTESIETAKESATPEPAVDDLIKVVALKSFARQIDSAVVLRGQTEAARQVDVRAETAATVTSEPLRKGSFVKAGTLLCELDPGTRRAILAESQARQNEMEARALEAESRVPESQARVIEAQAFLDEAMVNQNAAQRLSQDGYASETRVKNADAAVAAAKASVEAARSGLTAAESGIRSAAAAIESAAAGVAAAEKEIERLKIRAPFDGLLESDTSELGSLLQAGGLCATVIQLDPIKLVAFVPETEVNRISLGAMSGARLAAGGNDVAGKVTFLSRSADTTTRTFRVEIEVPNTDLAIRDGQTAEILIAAEGAKAHLVPSSAMTLDDAGTLGLRIVDDAGVVAFNPVSVVRDTPQGVWLAGLPDIANVIVVGQEYVRAGVKTAPTFKEATQ